MEKLKERVVKNTLENIPGRAIYQTPERMGEVLPDKRKWLNKEKPEPGDIVKAQVEKFREIYRILRSELYDPGRSGDSSIIAPDTFPEGNTIESHLLNWFPQEYTKHIQFACYIEEFVNTFPADPIRSWITVSTEEVRNLIGNAFNNGLDRYEVQTFLGTYLWSITGEEHTLDGVKGRLIQSYTISKIYDTFRVSADKVREIWSKYGISFEEYRIPFSNTWETQSEVFIPHKNIIFQMTKVESAPVSRIAKVRRDTKFKLQVPENLSAKLTGYFFHYPVDAEGIFNPIVPLIFDNEKTLTIPLVHKVVPMVIAALFPVAELIGLLGHLKANSRASIIKTIFKNAQEGIYGLNETLRQFNKEQHDIRLNHLDNRDTFLRLMTGLSAKGVNVDIVGLENLVVAKLAKKHKQRSMMDTKRKKILKLVSRSGGKLFSQYHIKSRTERVYTRHYNIQGLPKIFHSAIIPEPNQQIVYFDVIANDLSMLFNMVNDLRGLDVLINGGDPYKEISVKAFGDDKQRDRVKMFVSPHLYGAADSTIVEDSEGKLNLQDIIVLKRALKTLYPVSMDWLKGVRKAAGKGLIPSEYNLIDGVYIPIPLEIGSTVGPAMLIQRYGAILFRAIICGLAGIGYSPSVFVHDSLILQVSSSVPMEEHIAEIKTQINIVRRSLGLRALSMMVGHGSTWEAADMASERRCFHD